MLPLLADSSFSVPWFFTQNIGLAEFLAALLQSLNSPLSPEHPSCCRQSWSTQIFSDCSLWRCPVSTEAGANMWEGLVSEDSDVLFLQVLWSTNGLLLSWLREGLASVLSEDFSPHGSWVTDASPRPWLCKGLVSVHSEDLSSHGSWVTDASPWPWLREGLVWKDPELFSLWDSLSTDSSRQLWRKEVLACEDTDVFSPKDLWSTDCSLLTWLIKGLTQEDSEVFSPPAPCFVGSSPLSCLAFSSSSFPQCKWSSSRAKIARMKWPGHHFKTK